MKFRRLKRQKRVALDPEWDEVVGRFQSVWFFGRWNLMVVRLQVSNGMYQPGIIWGDRPHEVSSVEFESYVGREYAIRHAAVYLQRKANEGKRVQIRLGLEEPPGWWGPDMARRFYKEVE